MCVCRPIRTWSSIYLDSYYFHVTLVALSFFLSQNWMFECLWRNFPYFIELFMFSFALQLLHYHCRDSENNVGSIRAGLTGALPNANLRRGAPLEQWIYDVIVFSQPCLENMAYAYMNIKKTQQNIGVDLYVDDITKNPLYLEGCGHS